MTSKQSLTVAVALIAITITMLIAAASGDRDAYGCQGSWQPHGAVVRVGHHDGWRNRGDYDPISVCDEDGDECDPSEWSDDGDDDCEPLSEYVDRYYPSKFQFSGFSWHG